jgi:rubredoxin
VTTEKPKNIKEVVLEGMIGETSDFFRYPTQNLDEMHINMAKVTFINSVGVKHWILWATKTSEKCKVLLLNCPFMIASQASTVVGFLPKNFLLESFFAPFLCPDCETEKSVLLQRGTHYDFAHDAQAAWKKVPDDMVCDKCKKAKLEPDFFEDKVFAFLNIAIK